MMNCQRLGALGTCGSNEMNDIRILGLVRRVGAGVLVALAVAGGSVTCAADASPGKATAADKASAKSVARRVTNVMMFSKGHMFHQT